MYPSEKELIFGVFIFAATLFLLAGLVVLLIYNYFRVRSQKEKDILKTVFETQESERNRITEDLHDDIGAKLSSLKLQNELLIAEPLSDAGAGYAKKNAMLIDVIVRDIRRIVRNQSSKYIIENGIEQELISLCNQYQSLKGVNIELENISLPYPLNDEFQVSLYRILQELLHNTIKHSLATSVKIAFSVSPSELLVFYSDNGKGFNEKPAISKGMGLLNIETRVRLFDGQVTLESDPGNETNFRMQFAWKNITGMKRL